MYTYLFELQDWTVFSIPNRETWCFKAHTADNFSMNVTERSSLSLAMMQMASQLDRTQALSFLWSINGEWVIRSFLCCLGISICYIQKKWAYVILVGGLEPWKFHWLSFKVGGLSSSHRGMVAEWIRVSQDTALTWPIGTIDRPITGPATCRKAPKGACRKALATDHPESQL